MQGHHLDPRDLDREAELRAALEHIAHYLPDQGPIEVFIHHNTLHGFQHLPFHEAVAQASVLYGARPYLSDAEFRGLLASGRIRESDLEAALAEHAASERRPDVLLLGGALSNQGLRHLALRYPIDPVSPATLRWLLDEEQLASRIPPEVPPEVAAPVVREGAEWLRRVLHQRGLGTVAEVLTGHEDLDRAGFVLRERVAVPMSVANIEHLLIKRPAALVTSAIWQQCLRLTAGRSRAEAALSVTRATHRDWLRRVARSAGLLDEGDVAALVHPLLIRTCSVYLDLGFAQWEMPGRHEGYYRAARRLLARPVSGPDPWLRAVQRELAAQAEADRAPADVALEILDELGVQSAEQQAYLSRLLLELPGWAGMMSRLERHPEDRAPGSPPASLLHYVAILLTLEREALRLQVPRLLRSGVALCDLRTHAAKLSSAALLPDDQLSAYRLFKLVWLAGVPLETIARLDPHEARRALTELDAFDAPTAGRIWHEAFERTHRERILDALIENRGHGALSLRAADAAAGSATGPATAPDAKLQIFFCFDEREESIRRAIEGLGPEYQTFGVPGFYGMAMDFRGIEEPHHAALCPVVMKPAHEVEELPHPTEADRHHRRARLRRAWARLHHLAAVGARAPLHGAALMLSLGLFYLLPLTLRILFPRSMSRLQTRLLARLIPAPRTVLRADREPGAATRRAGRHLGFTTEELAQRAATLLENAGLTRGFAPIVLLLGHGATTRNNPHASAYNCGACGGRRGGANARLFATAVNRPEVRAELRARGIDLSERTWFLAGVHDTASDAIELFDLDQVPTSHHAHLAELQISLRAAAERSAHERCRRFARVPHTRLSPTEALRHVEARAESIAEPRPEYGHATNAVCIVGRRALTRGLFLDRRAFLISYDPTQDASGAILERILAAATPVGAGINLEYFFSAVDNERYGCGTKLAHNLAGLLGVMNGTESDLRTGLPLQTVEIHEPMRMLTIVEATPETLQAIAARQAEVRELIVNRWIQLVSIDPQSGAVQIYTDSGFVPYSREADPLPIVRAWEDWYVGRDEHLGPARLLSPSPAAPPEMEPAHV